jgi:hypothetical protein
MQQPACNTKATAHNQQQRLLVLEGIRWIRKKDFLHPSSVELGSE